MSGSLENCLNCTFGLPVREGLIPFSSAEDNGRATFDNIAVTDKKEAAAILYLLTNNLKAIDPTTGMLYQKRDEKGQLTDKIDEHKINEILTGSDFQKSHYMLKLLVEASGNHIAGPQIYGTTLTENFHNGNMSPTYLYGEMEGLVNHIVSGRLKEAITNGGTSGVDSFIIKALGAIKGYNIDVYNEIVKSFTKSAKTKKELETNFAEGIKKLISASENYLEGLGDMNPLQCITDSYFTPFMEKWKNRHITGITEDDKKFNRKKPSNIRNPHIAGIIDNWTKITGTSNEKLGEIYNKMYEKETPPNILAVHN